MGPDQGVQAQQKGRAGALALQPGAGSVREAESGRYGAGAAGAASGARKKAGQGKSCNAKGPVIVDIQWSNMIA